MLFFWVAVCVCVCASVSVSVRVCGREIFRIFTSQVLVVYIEDTYTWFAESHQNRMLREATCSNTAALTSIELPLLTKPLC